MTVYELYTETAQVNADLSQSHRAKAELFRKMATIDDRLAEQYMAEACKTYDERDRLKPAEAEKEVEA